MAEARFWKRVAWILGLVLLGILGFNLLGPSRVPAAATSFLLGCLFSIALGYSVVCARASPAQLSDEQEQQHRRQQTRVGVVISIVLASAFLVKEVRSAPISWGLIPLILLSPSLLFREYLLDLRARRRTPRDRP
ncbi:MAG: hypothetical protein AMJ64_14040 [Betaproteobacteria bacterium SG8_39]|nr:MAG: hypothetical protein AMJ64_14040 [Betaproteobacteria bacterium SG8_39]